MPTYKNIGNEDMLAVDLNGLAKTVAPGESIETYQVLTGVQWEKTDTAPVYQFMKAAPHIVTAAGEEWQDQPVDPEAGCFEVRTDVDITIHPNVHAAYGYPLPAGKATQIKNAGTIEQLCLHFSGAGTATIIPLVG